VGCFKEGHYKSFQF